MTLPLTVRRDGLERYVKLVRLVPAGDWAVLWSHLIVPGAAQYSGRIDAVNAKTRATRLVTEALLAGGHFFDWRVEPGRVFWEKRCTTPVGIEVIESVVMDLDTGEWANQQDLTAALRSELLPLAERWAREQYGPEALVSLRFIHVHPNQDVQVHLDIQAPGRLCIKALIYQWVNGGWKLARVDDHSGSSQPCG